MLKGFKDFIMRGNVIDLAVAVVIGTAFTAIVNSIVENLFNPLIGALFNAESLADAWDVPITLFAGEAVIKFGAVAAALIQFLLIAAVVYFVFVFPMNKFRERAEARKAAGASETVEPPTELELLQQIRDLLAKDAASPSKE
ncbi:large conductance mechanosensitive channel protein MscL [Salinibacterium sp. dk2585]|uniref:large conductance mechanosensitive channel protein MscL n=1 Tax=unclassified Salinibacterium TaxID=2632331 RepID=UPI0011C2446C|nr:MULTISPECIES: large conductance mechanosensitive channel protein MscL [unclassified Salinibacterium]QEE62091.1 large conductance mechanosensitive channel protein MscL [Salinibacterium sp. dk2585]TXK53443.1 large conductance mechanosensitive channel protein MscL [Salinibacterium sp. dk5596]